MRFAGTDLRPPAARAALAAGLALLAAAAGGQAPEFRAMWATRFEWPNADPATCRARIDAIMTDLAGANFNAVFMQIRGQADVLYPSPYEVWSPLIGGSDPGWDPLAYAIAAAHARGLEFHAYINTHTCWQSVPASAHTPPANPNHLYYAHCNAADPARRDWLHHSSATDPVQYSESDYVWIAPGVPAYQAYIRQQVLHVVQNYAVDGVHFDRIRTPWSNQPSYDPISLARFADSQSNPGGLDFTHWTADQITRTVCDIYAAIMAVRPTVKVSAAVYSNPFTAPTAQHQEALRWLELGGMDMAVPMMYFTGGEGSSWDSRLQAWLAGASGRHIVAGHITSQGISSLLEQVALTRLRGGHGNSVFSWSSFSWWDDYLSQVYQVPVATPLMPWKTSPLTGIIYGYVTDAAGGPVVDVQVTASDLPGVALSSGDGFYSLLLVDPGTYTLDASHPAYPPAQVAGVAVAAGQVVRQDIGLAGLLPPIIAEVTPDPDSAVAGQEYTRQLQLVQGTATEWQLLVGPPGAQVSGAGLVSGWTPGLADVGQRFALVVRASNSAGHDDEGWSVLVAGPPPCEPFMFGDFEGFANGTRVLFQQPRYSGTTSGDLAAAPNVAEVSDAVPAFGGTGTYRVEWQYIDTDPQRWMRLTTSNAPYRPNPTVTLDRPVRFRLRLDSGRLRVCIGIRETATTADVGADGGTSGPIEWVGAATDASGAPQGVLVEARPGEWQTLVFDPLTDPVHGFTGDGVLWTPTGKGVFEHIGFAVVDSVGPFTVWLDNVELLCALPAFGDLNGDGQVDYADFLLFADCLHGPDVPVDGACQAASADGDPDVDLRDCAALARELR